MLACKWIRKKLFQWFGLHRKDLLHLNGGSCQQHLTRMIQSQNLTLCVGLLCLYIGYTKCNFSLVLLDKILHRTEIVNTKSKPQKSLKNRENYSQISNFLNCSLAVDWLWWDSNQTNMENFCWIRAWGMLNYQLVLIWIIVLISNLILTRLKHVLFWNKLSLSSDEPVSQSSSKIKPVLQTAVLVQERWVLSPCQDWTL